MQSQSKQAQPQSKVVYIDNSVNPGFLDIDYHYVPNEIQSGERILKIKVPGDGNCGLYSIALGLANLIVQDKLVLSDQTYNEFLSYMLKDSVIRERAQYYIDGIAVKDGNPKDEKRVRLEKCLPHIERIVKALKENKLKTFAQFKRFMLNYTSYYEVLALAICMGPALRDLTVDLNAKLPSYPFTQYLGVPIIEPEKRDGKDASFEQLKLLESFFGFHLRGYNRQHQELGSNFDGIQPPTQAANLSSSAANVNLEDEKEEVDPLLGKSFGKPMKQKESSHPFSLSLSSTKSNDDEEKAAVDTALPLHHDLMPTISIAHSDRPGHFDLLLPMSDYLSPPFYFGFDFVGVDFEQEAQKAKQQLPPDLAALQITLAHEKKRIQQFRQEIIKLKIAVNALSSTKEFETGKKLIQVLESNLNTLFIPKAAPVESLKAQEDAFVICSKAVKDAHEQFKKNRPTVANILANIGLFIATLGVGYLVAGALHYCSTGRIGFFNKPANLLRNELPAFSTKLVELHKERGTPSIKEQTPSTVPDTVEELPPLPAFKEWSKIRI